MSARWAPASLQAQHPQQLASATTRALQQTPSGASQPGLQADLQSVMAAMVDEHSAMMAGPGPSARQRRARQLLTRESPTSPQRSACSRPDAQQDQDQTQQAPPAGRLAFRPQPAQTAKLRIPAHQRARPRLQRRRHAGHGPEEGLQQG